MPGAAAQPVGKDEHRGGPLGRAPEDGGEDLADQHRQADRLGQTIDETENDRQQEQPTAPLEVRQVESVTAALHGPSVAKGSAGGNTKRRVISAWGRRRRTRWPGPRSRR